MKVGTKLLVAAILSLSVGIAAASPLLFSEMNIQPYPALPQGPKPDVNVDLAYASFSVQPTDASMKVPQWYRGNDTPSTVAYNMVLNVTNLSDEYVTLDFVQASAAQNYTRGGNPIIMNGVTGTGGTHKGAYLDGELVNVTWIPNSGLPYAPQPDISGYPSMPAPSWFNGYNTSATGGYWREGVEIADTYVNGTLAYTYMYINGTWTDVTGRVQVPDREDIFSSMASATHTIASSWYTFQAPFPDNWNSTETHTSTSTQDYGNGTTVTTTTTTVIPIIPSDGNRTVDYSAPNSEQVTIYMRPGTFNNTWAPHESRLIMLNGTVFAYDNTTLQYLQTGNMAVHIMGQARLSNMLVNGTAMDTSKVIDVIEQIQVQPSGNSFVYNAVLGANQMFQPDQSGIEVFVKPRS